MTIREFERLYHTMYMPLCMYALRMLEDIDETDDAVQEAFVSVWQKVQHGTVPDNFRAYMYGAVRNQAISRIRARNNSVAADMAAEVSDEEMDTSVRDAEVWNAIDRLPPHCREIFLLSKRDGLTYTEIADELGISVKTVENQISKALKNSTRLATATIGQNIFPAFFIIFSNSE